MDFISSLKSALIQGLGPGNLSTPIVVVSLAASLIFGLYIYCIYRFNCKSGFYDEGFSCSLAIMPPVTAGIILAMQSNVLISLGMVGALSIVRFRNAVKNPMDLTYLFWSISMGIVTGIGLLRLGILLSLCITIMILGLKLVPTFRAPYILVVSGEKAMKESELLSVIKENSSLLRIRSRNISRSNIDWVLEIKAKDPSGLIEAIGAMEGILSANLLSHDGEVRF